MLICNIVVPSIWPFVWCWT